MPIPMNSPRRSRSWLGVVLRLCGTAAVFALLFHFLPLGELGASLHRVPISLWCFVLGAYLLVHVVGVVKWRLMLNAAGAGLSFAQSVRCYGGGLFGTLFLPSIIGGDVVRVGLALRLSQHRAAVAVGSVLDRLVDMAALGALALLGILLLPTSLDSLGRKLFGQVITIVTFAFLLTVLVLFILRKLLPPGAWPFRLRRLAVRLRRALRTMTQRKQAVVRAWMLGLAIQGALVWLTAVIASGCGLHLPFRAWLLAWPLAKLAALLPITQGGIGVREAVLVALVTPFGGPPALTMATGLVWEAIILAGGLIAGLTSYLLGHTHVHAGTARVPSEWGDH
jgi:glycosyltransferase 2 family protein